MSFAPEQPRENDGEIFILGVSPYASMARLLSTEYEGTVALHYSYLGRHWALSVPTRNVTERRGNTKNKDLRPHTLDSASPI